MSPSPAPIRSKARAKYPRHQNTRAAWPGSALRATGTGVNDDELWAAFGDSSLRARHWTHEAHVRVAFLFAQRFELDEAHLRMRAGIIRLNERHGLVETSARGYFETLTRVWLILVADARQRSGARTSEELLARCAELRDRALPARYYSQALLSTARARAIFVEPDLAPLPRIPLEPRE